MSRIAGVFSDGGQPAAALTAQLVAALSRPSWRRVQLDAGPVALATTSWVAPLSARRGEIIAVIDGRFFNPDELPPGADDAERLIALYDRLGFDGALTRINGDFAVALWDGRRGTLWLGRDRFGLKPLYVVERPGEFAFASQPRALLGLPGVSPAPYMPFVARFAASHYRTFDNEPERCPYAAVGQLPAGHLVELRNGVVTRRRWWTLAETPDLQDSEDELAERYSALLRDAVARRVAAARAPAFTLSGGLDSSSVLSCAVAATGARQHAYSSVYVDRTFDESEEIRPMLADKVKAWHPVELGNDVDVLDTVRQMMEVHDEPVATATWLSHFVLTRQVAADGFGALFGGLGGDELNAGEYEYFIFHFADLADAGWTGELEHEIARWAAHHDHPIYRKDRATALAAIERLCDPARPGGIRPDLQRLGRYVSTLRHDFADLADWLPTMDHPFSSHLKNRTYQDIFRETAPCCLRAEDRQCTAAGLERYDPFFDHRVVELMFRVPGTAKIRDGTTKILLRAAMRGLLPDETRTRIKKTGWNAPAHVWFTGPGLAMVRDLAASQTFRQRGIYEPSQVDRVICEHAAIVADGEQRENHAMFLWQLINLELWLQAVERW
ncbi:MAG TPA: asparagine synthase-related protein [Xanthobacteraceae bacterium]|nr:asparagine synthase-related protein [Xanthobacteraceae bacterium]